MPRQLTWRFLIKTLAVTVATFAVAIALAPTSHAGTDWRAYAKTQAAKVGWTGAEWRALDQIVTPESGWNPCRRFPSTTDCSYSGSNSCGLPQADPCPQEWRGRLLATARAQVAWLFAYIVRRYRDPLGALAFRSAHGWY